MSSLKIGTKYFEGVAQKGRTLCRVKVATRDERPNRSVPCARQRIHCNFKTILHGTEYCLQSLSIVDPNCEALPTLERSKRNEPPLECRKFGALFRPSGSLVYHIDRLEIPLVMARRNLILIPALKCVQGSLNSNKTKSSRLVRLGVQITDWNRSHS